MSTTARSSGSSSGVREAAPTPARVFLDANALFLPFVGGTDLQREIDRLVDRPAISVPRSVVAELRRLAERGAPRAAEALQLASRFPVAVNDGGGDTAILALVVPGDLVVTADRELQQRLLARGVNVLVPRDRARLALRRGHRRGTAPARTPRGNG